MSFFAVLIALLIEQLKPLPRDNWVHERLKGWVAWVGRNFDAGREHHAWVVWAVSVAVPALAVAVAYLLLARQSLLLGLVVDVGVLYLTLGFRQFSHYFSDIRQAFDRGDEDEARRLLTEWLHLDARDLPRTELLRHVVEHALLAAHHHVFGVFFWFIAGSALGLGPTGAVLYRMAEFGARYWAYRQRALDAPANDRLARLTAFGFAVVGNFEEAINGWRRDAALWPQANDGVILAAAAGAAGVQLGGDAAPGLSPDRSQSFSGGPQAAAAGSAGPTPGVPLQPAHLQSLVGLVWRSVVLWMLLLALLTLANVLG